MMMDYSSINENEVSPNAITFNTIIDCCINCGQLD